MKPWMKKEALGPFSNLDSLMFAIMVEVERALKSLPEEMNPHNGHEGCLLAAGKGLRAALEADSYRDNLLGAVCVSASHHLSLTSRGPAPVTWEEIMAIYTWRTIYHGGIAVRCAGGFAGMEMDIEDGKITEGVVLTGFKGMMTGLAGCLTFATALKHCVDHPELTYKSSTPPSSIETLTKLPGYRGIASPLPQWLVGVLDAGIVPTEKKPSEFLSGIGWPA